ncbi:hypothetical protein [uncultured Hymenobacter sp.]|uniref:hypothetical protein n=1 Tax=uncultured Hymenobacter sp. TaxID=170016 RepID=UPI0035CC1D26
MKNRLLCSIFTSALLGLGGRAHGQATDSSAWATAASTLRQRYAAGLRYDSRLYDGPEYVNYVKGYVRGHPFFESAEEQEATIVYGGATYVGVPLRYDLLRGQLVLAHPPSGQQLRLVNEKVARFRLGGHTFIRLVADSNAQESVIRTGFYDLLVEGRTQLLAFRRKSAQARNTAEGREGEISQKNEFFLQAEGRYYSVTSAKQVLRLLPADKAALRQFSRAQKLKFSEASREQSLVALLRYYDSLPPRLAPTPASGG